MNFNDLKRMPSVIIKFFFLLVISLSVIQAKRMAPKEVNPVFVDGIKYYADHNKMGYLFANDSTTDSLLWEKKLYNVKIDKSLEEDVQWVFITDLHVEKNELIVKNEASNEFRIPLKVDSSSTFADSKTTVKKKAFWAFTSNPSVSAFIGAFSAFLFLILLDILRNVWRIKVLRNLLSISDTLARNKYITVEQNLKRIEDKGELLPGSIMEFQIDGIRQELSIVQGILGSKKKMVIDGMIHRMIGIDNILNENNSKILEYRDMPSATKMINYETGEKKGDALVLLIIKNFKEALINLEILQKMYSKYIAKKYDDVLTEGFQDIKVLD